MTGMGGALNVPLLFRTPPVIPNGERNLRSGSDAMSIYYDEASCEQAS